MRLRTALAFGLAAALALTALPASAHKPSGPPPGTSSKKLTLVGDTGDDRAFEEASFTDAAFQKGYAYQGTWNGFRIVDISKPWRPKEVAEVDCGPPQGDIGVYGDLVFRSVDTPVSATTPQETCDAPPSGGSGFEGVQIFQLRKPWKASAGDLVAAVPTDCGSHALTVVPDPRHHRVLLYVAAGETSPVYDNDPVWRHECSVEHDKFQIVSVPLRDPEAAEVIADVPLDGGDTCNDIGVLLSRLTKLAVCAGAEGIVFDIHNLVEPERLGSLTYPGVPEWNTAMLSKDGSVTAMSWLPGGGVSAECRAGDPAFHKSIFFFDTQSGDLLGSWVLPRAQSARENCAIGKFGVIPNRERNLLTVGAYQAGTYVVGFSDPTKPKTVAWYDPPPLDASAPTVGGAWGSYWYRGFVYESDVTKGLNVYRLEARRVKAKSEKVDLLNPQTLVWEGPRGKRKHRRW
jgi:LVIVD repeat